MTSMRAPVIAMMLALGAGVARADEPRPAPDTAPVDLDKLTDEELAALAAEQVEVIELWDERPAKPFDRDTELRLTGAQLAARGATDLATALALLPDVNVRDAGRGGFIVDIRGARKGAVRVLIDGVAVSDPYYGTFDVSTIPITDVEQIRVSTTPAAPIDGPGGPGGVIEVHTRDAMGGRAVIARLTTDSLPTFGASVSGRTALARRLAIRLSTSALYGARDFELATMSSVAERRRANTGAVRLEYRAGARRFALDGFLDDRRYVPPPSEESTTALILVIDRETTGRVQASFDDALGPTQVQGRAWVHSTSRRSRSFRDPGLTDAASGENLWALRGGGIGLLTRPVGRHWRWVASGTVDHERANVYALSAGPARLSSGDATLIEAAGALQYERGTLRVDGSAGIAAPLGLGADPWPEVKLVARWKPEPAIELIATAARKGRTPSLRERFDVQIGNPALAPELASQGELRAIATPRDGVKLEVAPYWRRSTGSVVADPMTSRLINLGTTDVRGFDASARVKLHDRAAVGGSYGLTLDRAQNADGEAWRDDPFDFLPDHRADLWAELTLPRAIVVTGRGRYFGDAVDRGMAVDGYYLAEASVAATFGDWLGVVRCDDLLDAAPETRSGFRAPGRVFSLVVQGAF